MLKRLFRRGPRTQGYGVPELKSGEVLEAKIPCAVLKTDEDFTWLILDATGNTSPPMRYGKIVAHDVGADMVFIARVEGSNVSHTFSDWNHAFCYIAFWGFLGEIGSPIT